MTISNRRRVPPERFDTDEQFAAPGFGVMNFCGIDQPENFPLSDFALSRRFVRRDKPRAA